MNLYKFSLSIVFLLFSVANFAQEQTPLDSLINVVKIQENDTTKVDNLNSICKMHSRTNADSAELYGVEALNLAQELDYKSGEALANKNLGNTFYFINDYSKAYQYYNKSLKIYEKINDKKGIAIIVRNLGSIYHQQGDYDKALEYFSRSLNLRIEIDDKKGTASLNNAIGLVFLEQGNEFYDRALEYFKKALSTYEELENSIGIAQSFYRVGTIYKLAHSSREDSADFSNLDKALDYAKQFLELSKQIGDSRLLAEAHLFIGGIYIEYKKFDLTLNNYKKSIELYKSINSQFGLANSYTAIGSFYNTTKKYHKSISYNKQALEIAEKEHFLAISKNASLNLRLAYESIGDMKNALNYYDLHIVLKDSLINEEKKNEIAKLEMNMDFQQKLKQQEMQQQKINIENEEKLKRQKLLSYFFIFAFFLMIGLAFVIYRSYRNKKQANKILEEKNDEISRQKQHIMDSIVYAKRIQNAVLPPEEFISNNFHEHFVLFKPRDIVSGDFYWAARKDNLSIIAAADCTGHGVPGAFMSMLGISFLNEIVNREATTTLNAGDVLTELRAYVKKSLRQTGKENEAQDGMDVALCIFDNENKKLQYAGAYNPLYIIRNKRVIKYKADRMPVGIYYREKEAFTNHFVDIEEGDQIYIFSDGFIDQFGGKEGEKFLTRRFKKLLLENSDKEMDEQKVILEKTYSDWTRENTANEYEQLDDILVIGIKVQ